MFANVLFRNADTSSEMAGRKGNGTSVTDGKQQIPYFSKKRQTSAGKDKITTQKQVM